MDFQENFVTFSSCFHDAFAMLSWWFYGVFIWTFMTFMELSWAFIWSWDCHGPAYDAFMQLLKWFNEIHGVCKFTALFFHEAFTGALVDLWWGSRSTSMVALSICTFTGFRDDLRVISLCVHGAFMALSRALVALWLCVHGAFMAAYGFHVAFSWCFNGLLWGFRGAAMGFHCDYMTFHGAFMGLSSDFHGCSWCFHDAFMVNSWVSTDFHVSGTFMALA